MTRGSKPDERRGGRQRATPNKRTVLTDRILATASSNPIASSREILLILVKDQALSAATRIAIAQKSFGAGRSRFTDDRAERASNRTASFRQPPLTGLDYARARDIEGQERRRGTVGRI
jgi:hypothetical protein